jgi:hypothetical protein
MLAKVEKAWRSALFRGDSPHADGDAPIFVSAA